MVQQAFRRYWISAVTSLHIGTGQATGFVDLPIARERATRWPFIPGASVKGVIRDYFSRREQDSWVNLAFGQGANDSAQAGALVFTDCSIVCLPVRSLYGTFAYITSPLALHRLARSAPQGHPEVPDCAEQVVLVAEGSALQATDDKTVYLEDLDFQSLVHDAAGVWAQHIADQVFGPDDPWRDVFLRRFLILSDESFQFLCETATEVRPRIRIDREKGTVADGAYWYEEHLPPETILSGVMWCDDSHRYRKQDMWSCIPSEAFPLQIGGHASTGHGRVMLRVEHEGGAL
jgi:CRISPR-associated protein Cmr4